MLFPQPNREVETLLDRRAAEARASHIPDRCEIVHLPLSCGCTHVYLFAESLHTIQGWCLTHRKYFSFLDMANC